MPVKGGGAMVESVMVDAVQYRVEQDGDTIVVDGQECGACVNYDGALIRIRDPASLDVGAQAKTLMHEIVHAILFERGRREEFANEELVDALASGFVNLVRQNPDLIEFIQRT